MSNQFDDRPADVGALGPFERSLAQFAPSAPRLDRDRLMFLAGVASSGGGVAVVSRSEITASGRWLWPASTAVLAATSLALAVALLMRPALHTVVAGGDGPDAAAPAPRHEQSTPAGVLAIHHSPSGELSLSPAVAIPRNNYVRTREVALRMGVEALGAPSFGGGPPAIATHHEFREMLAPARDEAVFSFDVFPGL
jgi:hypothetical protein